MDLNPKSGESKAGAVGAVEGERGQGDSDAKDKPSLKKDEANRPSSAIGAEPEGALEEARMKMGTCSLETTLEESLANRRTAWKEEVKKELEKRAELKRQMEAVPVEQVTKWEDKLSMSRMSTEWREGFKEERTNFLFNEVFPILLKKTPDNLKQWRDGYLGTRSSLYWNEVFRALPYRQGIYTVNNVLRCRQVSKSWKEAMDHCISTSLESFSAYRTTSGFFDHYYFPKITNQFLTLEKLIRFNKWSEQVPTGRNPCFSRKLLIGSYIELANGEYWREIDKLLQRWGGKIWIATIYLEPGMGMEMLYEMLLKYLTLMPNLRRLTIYDQEKDKMRGAKTLGTLGFSTFGSLKERMARKPLPELPHLRHILFNDSLPDPIISAILTKYRDSLESMHLERPEVDQDQTEFQVGPGGLPKLKQLFVSGWLSNLTFDFPLEDMALEGYKAEGKSSEDVIRLFKAFNSCGSTLRRLRMVISFDLEGILMGGNPDRFVTRPRALRLELPRLERILIDVSCTELRNLDFLLELGSLKELDLRYDKLAPMSGGWPTSETFSIRSSPLKDATIQFAGYEDRLHDSNIWKLLPKLKLVCLKLTVGVKEMMKESSGPMVQVKFGVVFEKFVTYTRDGSKCETVNNYD